jgi:hypothetical protein
MLHMGFLSRMFRTETVPLPAGQAGTESTASTDEVSADAEAAGALPDGESLRTLAGLMGAVPAPLPAAQVRMAQLLDAGTVNFATLAGEVQHQDALLSIAGMCRDPSLLAQLLDGSEPLEVARLVTEASSSRVRQLAAQRVADPAQLRQLLKQVRGKDKNVYKIIKQKCDELRAEEQKSVLVESDAAAACASLERHSHRIYDAVYEASLDHFTSRWQALAAMAAPGIQQRATHAIERCREIILEHRRTLALIAERQALLEAQQAAQSESLNRAQEESRRREEAAAAEAAAAEAQAHLRRAEEEAQAALLAAQAHAVRRLLSLIAKTHAALRDGDTGRAAGLRRAIDAGLPAIQAPPAHLTRQVQQLDAKLEELKQWKDFAVAPKRAELIADMEALIGSSEEPKSLADRIKQLQNEWKSISRGIVSDSQADWQRFHQAAEAAYQPCRAYFEAQAKLRQENLQQRQILLERLRNFETAHSGDNPDWRAIAAVVVEARQEWRRCSPVDRAAAAASQKEFDAALARLQQRLDAWYAQKIADKLALIERARALTGKQDIREAVAGAKHLQQLWKNIDPVERDKEQALWAEFRAQCDLVFAKRQQSQSEHVAALEANKAAALALCQEAEQSATLSGAELLEAAARIPLWRAAFEAIGEIPRAEQHRVRDRFEQAIKRCQAGLAAMRARDKLQSFDDMLEAARYIQAYGCAVAQRAAAAERDARKLAAETFIAGVKTWPKGASQALKDAWRKADNATELDMPANENALRLLCIRSEIAGDLPTPPDDQALRREHQMQRLTQRIGQRGDDGADDWETLSLAWVRVGPVAPVVHQSLLARFVGSRQRMKG